MSLVASKQGMLKLVNIIVAKDMRCIYLYPIKNLPAVNEGREMCMFLVEKCFAKSFNCPYNIKMKVLIMIIIIILKL